MITDKSRFCLPKKYPPVITAGRAKYGIPVHKILLKPNLSKINDKTKIPQAPSSSPNQNCRVRASWREPGAGEAGVLGEKIIFFLQLTPQSNLRRLLAKKLFLPITYYLLPITSPHRNDKFLSIQLDR